MCDDVRDGNRRVVARLTHDGRCYVASVLATKGRRVFLSVIIFLFYPFSKRTFRSCFSSFVVSSPSPRQLYRISLSDPYSSRNQAIRTPHEHVRVIEPVYVTSFSFIAQFCYPSFNNTLGLVGRFPHC